jgi:hypothetical protein
VKSKEAVATPTPAAFDSARTHRTVSGPSFLLPDCVVTTRPPVIESGPAPEDDEGASPVDIGAIPLNHPTVALYLNY